MLFVETSHFTRIVYDYLTDDEHSRLQAHLTDHPDAGDLIKGTGGIRKIRWSTEGRGKRGGLRVIYYWQTTQGHIYLLTIYGKNEASDLTEKEKALLKKMVETWNR